MMAPAGKGVEAIRRPAYNLLVDDTLLPGKLDRPVPRPNLLPRQHLKARLDGAVGRRLLLVAAAAGYGKTSLVASWCAARPEPVAWYSLDNGDNDPNRFLRYLLAAINLALPSIGPELQIALRNLPPPSPETVIQALLAQLANLAHPCLIVLDDYHLIENDSIHQAIHLLLSHLPRPISLLLLSRADPPFPLGRWRANGDLLELRAADLKFQPTELAHFFAGAALGPEQLHQLHQRTEGWPAGLQLAALALENSVDPAGFIAAFSGSNRFVLDYLLEEVLQGLPPDLRQFLLDTALLPQFNAPLCDAALERTNSASLLRDLERRNLFLIPLDQQRDWYRYHHLFADLLRSQLVPEAEAQRRAVHRRTAAWLAAHNRPETAVYHALQAADYDEAARLITGPALAASARSEVLTLRRWHEAFPAEFLSQNPLLALHFGVNFALNGRWSEAEALLEQIEAARSRLPMGSYLLWRYLMSHQLAAAGDWAELLANATTSAEREPLAAMVLGLLLGMRGETTAALGWLDQAINLGTTSGSELAITARVHRCRLLVQAGDYRAAW
ncbi:MAG: hypothetical protein KDE09_17140, partial [Anaerolineales bacterium]|nr:hypothetical protein [Anaerolineales bacterium]